MRSLPFTGLTAMMRNLPIMEPGSLDESVIDVMRADPKPHVLVGQPDSQGAVFQRYPRRPDFLPVAVAEFFELQGRVLRIVFQQGELLISPRPDVGGHDSRSRNPRSPGESLRGPIRG